MAAVNGALTLPPEVNAAFWFWYSQHANDVVIRKFWFVTVRVSDLKPFFQRIFGPAPGLVP